MPVHYFTSCAPLLVFLLEPCRPYVISSVLIFAPRSSPRFFLLFCCYCLKEINSKCMVCKKLYFDVRLIKFYWMLFKAKHSVQGGDCWRCSRNSLTMLQVNSSILSSRNVSAKHKTSTSNNANIVSGRSSKILLKQITSFHWNKRIYYINIYGAFSLNDMTHFVWLITEQKFGLKVFY